MRSNWQKLKTKCIQQNQEFQIWDQKGDYQMINHSHYDWWAFPLDRRSSYGDQYKVFPQDYKILSEDKDFINALRSNAILVCKAWGFDLVGDQEIPNPGQGQSWQNWPIRLYKISGSLQLFKQNDLLANSVKYAKRLIAADYCFSYGPKDLKPYYRDFNEEGIRQSHNRFSNSRHQNNQEKPSQAVKQEKPCQIILQEKPSQVVQQEKPCLGVKQEEKIFEQSSNSTSNLENQNQSLIHNEQNAQK